MKIEDVPQDKKNFKDGENAPKKVMYVTSADGAYTQTQSAGWEAENVVLEQAWDDIDRQLHDMREKVLAGERSPVAYFMIKSRMDLPILAAYAGKWQWQVKRHLQPKVFKQLSAGMIQKYADIFSVSPEELTHFAGRHAK